MENSDMSVNILGYSYSTRSVVAFVLITAAVIRVWGINYGLPYEGITYNQLTYEESQEVHRAFKLAAGEYAWVFGKGGLYFLLFVEAGLFYVFSLALGWVSGPEEFAVQVLQNRTPIYVMGRLTNVLLGLATYLVIYSLGRKLWGERVGLVALTIGAFAYLHGVFSTVINVDIGMVLFLWVSVLLYALFEEKRNRKYLFGAGIAGGISIAFKLPGAVVLPIVFLLMALRPENWKFLTQMGINSLIFCGSLFLSLTLVAPEWIIGVGKIVSTNLFGIIGSSGSVPSPDESIDDAIKSVSVIRYGSRLGYVDQLLRDYNLFTTVFAGVGLFFAIVKKNRWLIVLGVFAVSFVLAMSQSYRSQSQHYLLPIMPALWLLASYGVMTLYDKHKILGQVALVAVLVVPTYKLVQHDVEKTFPDTRIVAKQWIERNIDPNAKILIDGMQFRMIPSPPLQPDESTIARQVERASSKEKRIGRGVSDRTLDIYGKALSEMEGPSYNLFSTMHGVNIESLDYYVERCFEYVVTSSMITDRYKPGSAKREMFPATGEFYDGLQSDGRYREIYRIAPKRWGSIGPTITVYEVDSICSSAEGS